MAGFRSLQIGHEYKTLEHNLIRDFYEPVMEHSDRFTRAVAYFTSNALNQASNGIEKLIQSGGKMRLIVGPDLTKSDVDDIDLGYERRRDQAKQDLENAVLSMDELKRSWLAWLIASGHLDVKVAFVEGDKGIFHEKVGMFESGEDYICFFGTGNETEGGLFNNCEVFSVYKSWDEGPPHAQSKRKNIEAYWNNTEPGIKVFDFTDISRDVLRPYTPSKKPGGLKRRDPFNQPAELRLRDYQEEVINSWGQAGGRGIFSLATGTGKTKTALVLASKMHRRELVSTFIITAPYQVLVEQWMDELKDFETEPIGIYFSSEEWLPKATNALATQKTGVRKEPVVLVCTNDSFADKNFQQLIPYLNPAKTLLIADECHHLGSENFKEQLSNWTSPPRFRLGLSATPERYEDESGTTFLEDWFGKICQPVIKIREAIDGGYLCKYDYHLQRVELTESERLDLAKIWRGFEDNRDTLINALSKRSSLLSRVESKFAWLEKIARSLSREERYGLIAYCGTGNLDPTKGNRRLVDLAESILSKENYRAEIFTSRESKSERAQILKRFESGDTNAVVAIKCLDEGVDIPAIRTAILTASSSNPREFIQRRGRVLRKSPGKDKASIYDTVDLAGQPGSLDENELEQLKKQLRRHKMFSEDALNREECTAIIEQVEQEYGIYE